MTKEDFETQIDKLNPGIHLENNFVSFLLKAHFAQKLVGEMQLDLQQYHEREPERRGPVADDHLLAQTVFGARTSQICGGKRRDLQDCCGEDTHHRNVLGDPQFGGESRGNFTV